MNYVQIFKPSGKSPLWSAVLHYIPPGLSVPHGMFVEDVSEQSVRDKLQQIMKDS